MAQTFFFYDLETSGLNPREDRIMQFAGIRTDENFNPIGEPYNLLIRLNEDTLPSPGALMVTGITPQETVADGYTEAEFANILIDEIATPNTVIVGYNNIRFDDEFIRALMWRTYNDPYAWCTRDGRTRWDMLNVVRMTRALRPEGIEWPEVDGLPSNRLELLSAANGLEHEKAHDALSDVEALIGVTKLISEKQTDLFKYLFKIRGAKELKEIVKLDAPQPFIYSAGGLSQEHHSTTVAYPVGEAEYGNLYVYDMRVDLTQFKDMTVEDIKKHINTPWSERGEGYVPLPIKKLQYNQAPAVAPLGVLRDEAGWSRIGFSLAQVEESRAKLKENTGIVQRMLKVLGERPAYPKAAEPEGQLYDGFAPPEDKKLMEVVRNASLEDMKKLTAPKFKDERLKGMFSHYKARNFERVLTPEERAEFEEYRTERLGRQAPGFMEELQKLSVDQSLTSHQQYVLEELKLWFESISPTLES